jgi:hypothetical protein
VEKGEEKRMIICDGYSIEQYPLQNRVVITLPQTAHSLQDTHMMPQDRRVELTSNELTAILVVVKGMYEGEGEEE